MFRRWRVDHNAFIVIKESLSHLENGLEGRASYYPRILQGTMGCDAFNNDHLTCTVEYLCNGIAIAIAAHLSSLQNYSIRMS
jgi:hypothetical protein